MVKLTKCPNCGEIKMFYWSPGYGEHVGKYECMACTYWYRDNYIPTREEARKFFINQQNNIIRHAQKKIEDAIEIKNAAEERLHKWGEFSEV